MLMKNLLDAAGRQEILSRLDQIPADRRPLWGKMNAAQMVGHITDPLLAAMGEKPIAMRQSMLRNALLRHLIIYYMPLPKGARTPPEFVHDGVEDLAKNVAQFKEVVQRFEAKAAQDRFVPHFLFGDLSNQDYGALMYKHINHHLRQFGA
jgi:hypothetical protein